MSVLGRFRAPCFLTPRFSNPMWVMRSDVRSAQPFNGTGFAANFVNL